MAHKREFPKIEIDLSKINLYLKHICPVIGLHPCADLVPPRASSGTFSAARCPLGALLNAACKQPD